MGKLLSHCDKTLSNTHNIRLTSVKAQNSYNLPLMDDGQILRKSIVSMPCAMQLDIIFIFILMNS